MLAAEIDLVCWVVLGLLWLALPRPLHAGHTWAVVVLVVTAVLAVALDLSNLAGSWVYARHRGHPACVARRRATVPAAL